MMNKLEITKAVFYWFFGCVIVINGISGLFLNLHIANILIITGGLLTIPYTFTLINRKIKYKLSELVRMMLITILVGIGITLTAPKIPNTDLEETLVEITNQPESGNTTDTESVINVDDTEDLQKVVFPQENKIKENY